mgnify:CR=1 FL=1
MKTWNSHRRRLERGMVAGVLSAVVLTASMSIPGTCGRTSNTVVYFWRNRKGAAIAVTANAGAAQNVQRVFYLYRHCKAGKS